MKYMQPGFKQPPRKSTGFHSYLPGYPTALMGILCLVLLIYCQVPLADEFPLPLPDSNPSRSDPDPKQSEEGSEDSALNPEEKRFSLLVNQHRRSIGCPPLKLHPQLQLLAREHSIDMGRRNFFSHTNPDGASPFDRIRSRGLRYRMAAENIALGQRNASEVLASWLASPGHRENIENCQLKSHGIGYSKETNHWTHLFADLR